MKLDDVPDLKSAKFTDRITIPVTPEMKDSLMKLKQVYKKDPLAWVRMLIDRELETIHKGA